MFNHQTHHWNQITTELHKIGIDYGVTDMPYNPDARTSSCADETITTREQPRTVMLRRGLGPIWVDAVEKVFWGNNRKFLKLLMRFVRGDVSFLRKTTTDGRIGTTEHYNDGVVKIAICEIFGVVRFSTFRQHRPVAEVVRLDLLWRTMLPGSADGVIWYGRRPSD